MRCVLNIEFISGVLLLTGLFWSESSCVSACTAAICVRVRRTSNRNYRHADSAPVRANRFQPDACTPCVHMSERRSSCETGYLSLDAAQLSHWDESAGRHSPTWPAIWSNHRCRHRGAVEHPTGARRNHNEKDAVPRQVHCGELSFLRHRLLGCFNSMTNAEMS